MRILFTYIGGLGHFYPLEPIARTAEAAGHTVAVAGSGRLAPQVEALGFEVLATSPARLANEPPPVRDPTPLPPTDARAAEIEFAENFADKGARRHATAIREHVHDWRPHVLVRDEADLGSAIAAEACGIPVATVQVLAAGTLIRPDLISPPLAAIRAEHGLPPDPELEMLTRGLVLSPFPASFRRPEGGVFSYRSGVPSGATRADRPRVYVTLGTVFNLGSGDLFERMLAGLAAIDADVLVTVGRHIDPAELGPQPPYVRIERFVPQDAVLRETDLVVSHGGSGALMGALTHGLPQVLLPLGADQPHNASRATELGLARTLDAATATPAEIGDAIRAALADEGMAARSRLVAEEIASLPYVDGTVPLLEALATGHQAT